MGAAAFLDGSWVCVGRAGDVPAPGDQRAVPVGSASLLLVRDGDGTLRRWFDVCRHRGHELLARREPAGPGDPLPVPRLGVRAGRRVPGHAAVRKSTGDGIDRAEFGLVPARVEQWHGWVRERLRRRAAAGRAAGNAGMVVDGYDAQRLVPGARHEYEVAANWKLIVENYLECYHCAPIHPELCEVTPPESGFGYPGAPAGSWVGGPLALRDGVQTMSLDRAQPRRADPGLPRPGPARSGTRRCCRPCWSARTRTT